MTQALVKIQISPESVPSTPSWFAEAAIVAQVLAQTGLLKTLEQRVRFARARFGTYGRDRFRRHAHWLCPQRRSDPARFL